MTTNQFKRLKPGDIVRRKGSSHGALVTANYGCSVTAIQTHHLTEADKWVLVSAAQCRDADADDSRSQERQSKQAPEMEKKVMKNRGKRITYKELTA